MKHKVLEAVECCKCGAYWYPRVKMPVKCPYCQSRHWNAKIPQRRATDRPVAPSAIPEAPPKEINP